MTSEYMTLNATPAIAACSQCVSANGTGVRSVQSPARKPWDQKHRLAKTRWHIDAAKDRVADQAEKLECRSGPRATSGESGPSAQDGEGREGSTRTRRAVRAACYGVVPRPLPLGAGERLPRYETAAAVRILYGSPPVQRSHELVGRFHHRHVTDAVQDVERPVRAPAVQLACGRDGDQPVQRAMDHQRWRAHGCHPGPETRIAIRNPIDRTAWIKARRSAGRGCIRSLVSRT